MAELEAGRPVAVIFPDQDGPKENRLGTLFLANTLSILKACPNPGAARKLVDSLLRPEVDAKLAESESHQLPVDREVKAKRPTAPAPARDAKAMRVNWLGAAAQWEVAQKFLAAGFSAE